MTRVTKPRSTQVKLRQLMKAFMIVLTFNLFLASNKTFIDWQWSDTHRVGCWVLSSASSEDARKAMAIRKSWGKYCHPLIFVTNQTAGIKVDWADGYEGIAGKSFRCWQFAYEYFVQHVRPPVDFILKADTDTFIMGQNMHKYLRRFDPTLPHYIGRQFVNPSGVSFVAGTAIILSRSSLAIFYEASHSGRENCSVDAFRLFGPAEDLALASCLKEVGVLPHNTQDSVGRERFMVFNPDAMYMRSFPAWYSAFSFNTRNDADCCSEEAVAFHYTTFDQLNSMEPRLEQGRWIWSPLNDK